METTVCSNNTVRDRSHISFFCGGDPYCEVVQRPENTHDMFDWVTRRSLPSLERLADLSPSLEQPADHSTFSPTLQTLYCLFKSHAEVWTSSSPHVFFCLRLVIGTYILPFFPCNFFYLICERKYLSLSIGNKSYSLSCETTLLVLSCDRIESAKFIVTS